MLTVPDRFEPSAQEKAKKGQSASKRIAMFIFIGSGIILTLVAMSIINSGDRVNGSNAPVNLFEASSGAQSIVPPRPKPPEPAPALTPVPQRGRPAYIPMPRVSDMHKQNQVQRLLAANAPTRIQASREQTNSPNLPTGNNSDTLAEVSRLLSTTQVPQQMPDMSMPFMPQQISSPQSDPDGSSLVLDNLKGAVNQHWGRLFFLLSFFPCLGRGLNSPLRLITTTGTLMTLALSSLKTPHLL